MELAFVFDAEKAAGVERIAIQAGEAMGGRILGGFGFAFRGARSGGPLGVAAIGGYLL